MKSLKSRERHLKNSVHVTSNMYQLHTVDHPSVAAGGYSSTDSKQDNPGIMRGMGSISNAVGGGTPNNANTSINNSRTSNDVTSDYKHLI